MKTIIFFFMMLCPLLALAQSDYVTNEVRSDSSSLYVIELDFSRVELSIDSGAMRYQDRFHEAYNKPYRSIRVDKTHQPNPEYPEAWLDKVETFIQYIPEEQRIKFWQEISLPVSIVMMVCLFAIMAIVLIVMAMPFANDDVTPHFVGIAYIICFIGVFIGSFIMKFPLTITFTFLSLISFAFTYFLSDRDNEEEGVKFYIAWVINILLLGATISFFVLGK